jgi:hypothetical protein
MPLQLLVLTKMITGSYLTEPEPEPVGVMVAIELNEPT